MTRGRAEIHDRRRYLAQGAYRVPISGLRCDTADEHQRFDKATRDLRNAANPVEVYEITTLGRGALAVAECVDCFNDAEHGSMMCALCRARHVRPSGRRSGRCRVSRRARTPGARRQRSRKTAPAAPVAIIPDTPELRGWCERIAPSDSGTVVRHRGSPRPRSRTTRSPA